MEIQILPITNSASDGDGRKWPKHHYVRNDEYFLEHIATDKWIKDLPGGPQPGVTYRLDRLPQGYAGFERARPGLKHVDRYIYGHPRGQFRSLNEFYPHFKHLMDHGDTIGCPCKNCNAEAKPPKSSLGRTTKGNHAAGELIRTSLKTSTPHHERLITPSEPNEPSPSPKRKFVDMEGTPDIYESMMRQLYESREESIDLPIEEQSSPDWWTAHASTKAALMQWRKQPRYVPRCGEVVLFVRHLGDGEAIRWDPSSQTFRKVDITSRSWLEQPQWQAAVVTQTPDELTSDGDLWDDTRKERSVTYSGFRLEPLPEPGNSSKPWTKQSKYIPLHAIRPFDMLRECLRTVPEKDWHPTIHHARRVASSFCVVGRYRFKGIWPNGTVFAMGVYIGADLILIGDAVRLLPRPREQKADAVTDIMVVSTIRLRFVNMDLEDDPEFIPAIPYQTCLHLSGRIYTLDPARSFDGVGKLPIKADDGIIPQGVAGLGVWYHYTDPTKPDTKLEVPYTRVFGRCPDDAAVKAWFTPPKDIEPSVTFRPINANPLSVTRLDTVELSRGLKTVHDARIYSQKTDERIQQQIGRQWYWADTRIEQLDLHEVNDRYVGTRHEMRTNASIAEWRAALKTLTGKKSGLMRYTVVGTAHSSSVLPVMTESDEPSDDLVTSGVEETAGTDTATEDDKARPSTFDLQGRAVNDVMQIDDDDDNDGGNNDEAGNDHHMRGMTATPKVKNEASRISPSYPTNIIDLQDSGSEDETSKQLAEELAKNIRSGDGARMQRDA